MMKRMLGWAVLLLALIATPIASGDRATNVFIDEVVPAENPCTGELLVFEVSAHFLFHSTEDMSGGTHELFRVHGQRVSGVSDTGTRYTGKFIESSVKNDNGSNAQTEETTILQFRVVSGAGSDNFFLRVTSHGTVNAQGEPTAEFTRFDAECRG